MNTRAILAAILVGAGCAGCSSETRIHTSPSRGEAAAVQTALFQSVMHERPVLGAGDALGMQMVYGHGLDAIMDASPSRLARAEAESLQQ